jgi:arylsulfatase A-like enzyme
VLFASDNGPWLVMGEHAGSALPLREGKNTTFEGGVRVPALARWPGRIPAGTTSREAMGLIDVLPTVAGLAGAGLPPERVLDGRDVWPLLAGTPGATSPHEALYVYRDRGLEALRSGRWKLHLPHAYDVVRVPGRGGEFGALGQERIETALFDLVADPGETTDVAAAHPEVVAQLLALAEQGRRELGDKLTGRTGGGVRPEGRVP